MGRIIDADKLKKDVLALQDCYSGFSDTYDKACIIGVIDEQPTLQPEPQWIPCSERLPEEDQYNLVTMQHANGEIDVVIARLVKPYLKNVPWEWESDDAEWTWSFGNGFAWMPLPEPYQAERKDE